LPDAALNLYLPDEENISDYNHTYFSFLAWDNFLPGTLDKAGAGSKGAAIGRKY